MLSMTTAFSPAKQIALIGGLEGLSQWTAQLATYAQLGQQLPLVADTLGDMANVSTALQGLHDRLNTLVQNDQQSNPGGIPDSPNQIVADLQSLSTTVGAMAVSVSSASGSEASDGAPVYFTFDLHGQQTLSKSINLGSLVTSSQENVTGTASLSLQSSVDFTFTIGIDESPNLTPAQMFLFQPGTFTVQATGSAVIDNVAAQVGFLSGSISGGSLSVAANLQVLMPNAVQLRLSDLQAYPVGGLVQVQDSNSSISANLPFSATLAAAGQTSQTVVSGTIAVPQFDPFTGTPTVDLSSARKPVFERLRPGPFRVALDPAVMGQQPDGLVGVFTPGPIDQCHGGQSRQSGGGSGQRHFGGPYQQFGYIELFGRQFSGAGARRRGH